MCHLDRHQEVRTVGGPRASSQKTRAILALLFGVWTQLHAASASAAPFPLRETGIPACLVTLGRESSRATCPRLWGVGRVNLWGALK